MASAFDSTAFESAAFEAEGAAEVYAASWRPVLVERPWRRWGRLAPILTSTVEPIPTIPFASILLSWIPTYPSRVWLGRPFAFSARGGISLPPQVTTVTSVFGWRPILPAARVSRLRAASPQPTYFLPPQGALLAVAQRMGWAPMYPNRLRTRLLGRQIGAAAPLATIVTPPSVFAEGIPCVDLANEAFATPSLITQTAAVPTLINQAFTTPTLTGQDFC